MKSSNLAARLEELDALEKLRLEGEPPTRVLAAPGAAAETARPVRRARRGGIVIRDAGLRPFRVR